MSTPIDNSHDPFNTKRKTIYKLSGWRWIVFWPAALFLRLWFWTWRIEIDAKAKSIFKSAQSGRLIMCWHNRSLVFPEIFRRLGNSSKNHCLISPSKMAAWEVAFFDFYGLKAIRGSSSRRGIAALREIYQALRRGEFVSISPDGPSGPIYEPKKAIFAIARKTQTPILFMAANSKFSLRLNTWDRHLVPLPFAKIEVKSVELDPENYFRDDAFLSDIARTDCLELTEDSFQIPSNGK